MITVAYLANRFPAAVEPYVGEEIQELSRRGIRVIGCSVRKPAVPPEEIGSPSNDNEILSLQPLRPLILLQAVALALRRCGRIAPLAAPIFGWGKESPKKRLKAVIHTWLGACYAVHLKERGVNHIHVHHGYFGSWIAMVAAQLLGVSYSLTLHGSDLLLDGAFLAAKLEHCRFCTTISEYNRGYILRHFPTVDQAKISVSRLGVDIPESPESYWYKPSSPQHPFTLLAVGRLHAVKDHAFLLRACAQLRDRGLNFDCMIAGDGPERQQLEWVIKQHRLHDRVTLLGHIERSRMNSLYSRADVVVLTSRSEGLPLVLMEAMARRRIVLAPAITGIPEIVIPGKTGFLYRPGAEKDFVEKILLLAQSVRGEGHCPFSRLDWIRHAAQVQVRHNFNHTKNLTRFGDHFLQQIAPTTLVSQSAVA